MTVPYSFGSATSAIPLSQLDSNFNTPITLGNTAIQLGNTVTTLNNMTLANVTVSSGTITLTDITASGNVTLSGGTANGVAYLNGSKVVTTGSALRFDGTNLGIAGTGRLEFATSGGTFDNYIQTVNSFNMRLFCGRGSTSYAEIATDSINFGIGGSEQMRLTSTGLGVGTSTIGSDFKTVVYGGFLGIQNATTGTGNNNGLYLGYASGSTLAYIYQAENDALTFSTNSTERMRLSADGNLGLGVTPSAWYSNRTAFQIGGTVSALTGNSQFELRSNAYLNASASETYINTYYACKYAMSAGTHAWSIAASGNAGTAISFTQAMTLDASGNLMLGTTSSAPANANGVIAYGGADAGIIYLQRATGTDQLRFYTGGNRLGYVNTASSTLTIGTANFPLAFSTNDTERARIDSSGNLLINTTTSTPASITAHKLVVERTSTVYAAAFGYVTDSTARTQVSFYNSNGAVGTISTSGTATAYNTSSDERLKKNIQDAETASSLIDGLQVRQFDWKSDNSHQRYGFIAQELLTVVPEAVHQPENSEEMMAVDYSKLVPMLVKEIQSLRSRIAVLEAK